MPQLRRKSPFYHLPLRKHPKLTIIISSSSPQPPQYNWLLLPPTITNPPRGGIHLSSRSLTDFNPSLTSKASAKTRRLIEENNDAEMAYSGARAAWSLFGGDSELARVLLRSAVRLNGHVMTRLLGGLKKPGTFCSLLPPCSLPRPVALTGSTDSFR